MPANVDFPLTLTAAEDMVDVAVAAVDYRGTWPKKGGISGTTLKLSELMKLAESVRGMSIHPKKKNDVK